MFKGKKYPGLLVASRSSVSEQGQLGFFCGPAGEGGEGDTGAIPEHKLSMSHPILHSAVFLIILVCANLTS